MTAVTGIDTREMIAVHSAFRREFREAPALVRGVAPGDRARAGLVGDHVQLMLDMLHHHHAGEDRLCWPKLEQRVAEDMAPTVALMQRQHEGVHSALQRATEALPRWRSTASEQDREELAAAIEGVTGPLVEHLDAEEEQLLPLASRHLSQEEWNELGKDGMGAVPKKQLPTVFGMIMKDADPQVIRRMLASAPPPVRLLLPRLAPGAYRRYARRLQGG